MKIGAKMATLQEKKQKWTLKTFFLKNPPRFWTFETSLWILTSNRSFWPAPIYRDINFVLKCLPEQCECVSSDRKNQNIRHSWKRLWILTKAKANTGVYFRILPKKFHQNIYSIVPCCNTIKDPNGLLHQEWPEIPHVNTSSLGIS